MQENVVLLNGKAVTSDHSRPCCVREEEAEVMDVRAEVREVQVRVMHTVLPESVKAAGPSLQRGCTACRPSGEAAQACHAQAHRCRGRRAGRQCFHRCTRSPGRAGATKVITKPLSMSTGAKSSASGRMSSRVAV